VRRTVGLSEKQFRYCFTNTLSAEESKAAYERYAVPGPGRPLFQAGLGNFNPHAASKVNIRNDDRAPLLLLAGGKDHRPGLRHARETQALPQVQSGH
jgi:hypothetical protein